MPDLPNTALPNSPPSELLVFTPAATASFDAGVFLKTVPHKPGVYRMLNQEGDILYIGKAKDLRQRVSSYFRGTVANSRIHAMVKQIRDIQLTLTHTEAEALLLESNLIKAHKPRYNILLKDGKGYPYIYLNTQHPYPYIQFYRGSRKEQGQYFGPYPSVVAVRHTLNLMKKLFKVRQCEDSYFANRSRPCLEYQIKRCSAPCVGLVTPDEYALQIQDVTAFLQGRTQEVIDQLVVRMEQAATQLQFEKAAEHRDLIEHLRHISQQQYISGGNGNVDILALERSAGVVCTQVFMIRAGHNLGNHNFFPILPDPDATDNEVMGSFIAQYYLNHEVPPEVVVNVLPDDLSVLEDMLALKQQRRIVIVKPQRGERLKWLALAQQNAQHALQTKVASQANMQQRLYELMTVLGLTDLPRRMECFDISHTQGEATIASCVVFDTEGARKSDYRRYNIEGIQGGDDYAAMYQVLSRRFRTSTSDTKPLPSILLIDGGKGQVAQALKVLAELQVSGVMVVGVAKGEGRKAGLETLIIENGTGRLNLPEHSGALHLIQQIRDEAHRFAITGHRAKRQKARTQSPLETISGLGPKRRQQLLKQFGGIRTLQRASVEELAKVPSISLQLAQKIYNALNGE